MINDNKGLKHLRAVLGNNAVDRELNKACANAINNLIKINTISNNT